MGTTEKGMHSIKVLKSSALIIKIDLAKAYDKVCWLNLNMLMIQLGEQSDG
jgi:hypothetical protein